MAVYYYHESVCVACSGEEQTEETTPVDEEPQEMTLEEYRAKNPTVNILCN